MNSKNKRLDSVDPLKRLPLFGLAGVLLLVATAAEANWRVSPELGVGISSDDNTQLNDVPGSSSSDTGYGIKARATFLYDAELTDFSITPEIRTKKYSDNGDLDSTDAFLRFNFKHDRQKSNFRFRGDLSSESVRTAERSDVDFEIEDPEEIPVDDTGRVFDTEKRDRVILNPEFSYQLSERARLRVLGSYQDTSYDANVSSALRGFEDYDIGASLGFGWTEKDTVSINAITGKYQADGSSSDSATNAFGLGYNHRISERSVFRLLAGSSSSEDQNGNDQSNAVGEVSFIHRYVTTRVIASYQRRISGSGTGGLAVRNSVSLNVSRDLSAKLTLSGGVRAYTTDALDSSDPDFVERDYLQIRALARWNLSRTVSLEADYRYTDIDRNIAGIGSLNGDGNIISLWVYWHPNRLLN